MITQACPALSILVGAFNATRACFSEGSSGVFGWHSTIIKLIILEKARSVN